jgi:PKD repeat protein
MKKLIFILTVVSVFIFSSCKKLPEACFTADKTTIEIGDTVTFTSCASEANSVSWDFGDGTTGEGESVTHSFAASGTYIVQMRVTSKKDKSSDRYSIVITVRGYTRYVTKIVLKSFVATKPDNSTWDNAGVVSNPEPDVFVRLKPNTGSWEYNSSAKSDIKSTDLPFTWQLTQQNIYLSNQMWTVDLRDDDSFGTNLASESMNTWTVNPATAGDNGIISLTATGYSLDIYFENR